MFVIDDGDVIAGGVKRGKVVDILLFVGVKDVPSSIYYSSKNGFCLFTDGRYCIQEGRCIRDGVAKPYERGGLFVAGDWSWQVRESNHLIWIRDRKFIIPIGASAISFENADGAIVECEDRAFETKKVDAHRVRSVPGGEHVAVAPAGLSISVGGGAVAIGPGAVASAGGVAIGGGAPSESCIGNQEGRKDGNYHRV